MTCYNLGLTGFNQLNVILASIIEIAATITKTYMHTCSVMSYSFCDPHDLQPTRLLCPQNLPGQNTGMGCLFLLQGIFLIQGMTQSLGSPALQEDSLPTVKSSRQAKFNFRLLIRLGAFCLCISCVLLQVTITTALSNSRSSFTEIHNAGPLFTSNALSMLTIIGLCPVSCNINCNNLGQ